MKTISPTPYPDVNEILDVLLSDVQQILGDQFIGMYLYGSLSSGDFNPETSDVDFLVVTRDLLSDEHIAELESMHQKIWAGGLKRADRLEGSYIPQKDLRRHDPNNAPCPTINEGKFYVDRLGSDWIVQRHIVREYGVALAGPDP
ncbi:MAG TPA: nucleotidyltransferase domain-containing protein, partial [Anaerolineales bacterium]|nr:nucleotidyltransferase domain-containing protein [Anaerolineales bacterium]